MKNKRIWTVVSVFVVLGLLIGGFGCAQAPAPATAPAPAPKPTPTPTPTPIPWVENCESLFTPEERACLASDNCTSWQLFEMHEKLTVRCLDYGEVLAKLIDARFEAALRLDEPEPDDQYCGCWDDCCLNCRYWKDSYGFMHCEEDVRPFYPEPEFPSPP